MKLSFVRTGIAVALVALLASCGGKASFEVRGTIRGLAYPGLELTNGNDTLHPQPPLVAGSDVPFAFPTHLDYGATYDVKIPEQPISFPDTVPVKKNPLHQNCVVSSGADTAGRLAAINIIVSCTTDTHAIGGTVTGLTTDGLVLINGSLQKGIPKFVPATPPVTPAEPYTYTFASPVPFGVTYGVSVFKQPTGQTCTVSNPSGIMGDVAVTNINVHCI